MAIMLTQAPKTPRPWCPRLRIRPVLFCLAAAWDAKVRSSPSEKAYLGISTSKSRNNTRSLPVQPGKRSYGQAPKPPANCPTLSAEDPDY